MQVVKTVKLKLFRPTRVKQQLLFLLSENQRLLDEYVALIEKHGTSKSRLHKLTYKGLRSRYKLPSAMLQSARDKAVEAYKGYKTKKRNCRKARKPCFGKGVPVRLDKRMFSVVETDNRFRYFASIATSKGRIFVPLLGQRYQYKYLSKLFQGELQQGTAELLLKEEKFFVYLTVKKESNVPQPDTNFTPVGVDLGLNNLSTSVILKDKPRKARFFSGKPALKMRRRFSAFRKSLGKAKKLWRIRASKEKEARCMRDINHKASAAIVRQALAVENPVIVLEKLQGIRQRPKSGRKLNRMLNRWAFAQLQQFIEYKAKWNGIPVAYVKPNYTSQRCSSCGYTVKANRKGKNFVCRKCGYQLNADLNAAINIAKRYKNFASGYMLDALGDVATPLTSAVERKYNKVISVLDRGSPRL